MSLSTYFVQDCPTCGRKLQIRVEYLGRQVACQHCGGRLLAIDPESEQEASPDSGIGLLRRADQLLGRSCDGGPPDDRFFN